MPGRWRFFRRRERVDFYAATWIDELWVRSTLLAYRSYDRRARLVISGAGYAWPPELTEMYARLRITTVNAPTEHVLQGLGMENVVTASSSIPRRYFGASLRRLIHMPHSLASLHAIYPEDSFDGFDTLFAAGPHHIQEFRALSESRGILGRETYSIGYGKIDIMRQQRKPFCADGRHCILIAPSWGEHNLMTSVGEPLIDALLNLDYRVVLRPHPSFVLVQADEMRRLREKWQYDPRFTLEVSTGVSDSLWSADLMISDYSGTALEFAALRARPVLFVDLPQKVTNPNWKSLGLIPVEIGLRESLGVICPATVADLISEVSVLCAYHEEYGQHQAETTARFLFDTPHVGRHAATCIRALVERRQ